MLAWVRRWQPIRAYSTWLTRPRRRAYARRCSIVRSADECIETMTVDRAHPAILAARTRRNLCRGGDGHAHGGWYQAVDARGAPRVTRRRQQVRGHRRRAVRDAAAQSRARDDPRAVVAHSRAVAPDWRERAAQDSAACSSPKLMDGHPFSIGELACDAESGGAHLAAGAPPKRFFCPINLEGNSSSEIPQMTPTTNASMCPFASVTRESASGPSWISTIPTIDSITSSIVSVPAKAS